MTTTCIRNADWAIVWNGPAKRHEYRRGVDVVFADSAITHIGPHHAGMVDREIDGRRLLVMPGLVNLHCHPTNQPLYKGVREELGNPHFYGSGLYDFMHLLRPDPESRRAGTAYTYCELLKSGVTTVADLTVAYDGWVDLAADSGLRVCIAPMFRAAEWVVRDGRSLDYRWDEQAGRKRFDEAVRVVETAERHPSKRLFGMIAPGQIDTCGEELLRDSVALARSSRRPFQVHTSQSVVEFNEMTRRHGKTPVQWAHDIGLLGPGTGLGHAIFVDSHSWVHWTTRRDIAILADTGTNVAHCPTVFARYGHTLQSLGAYHKAGITIGIGTDTFPHNMIEEMRTALIMGRAAAGYMQSVTTADGFHMATVGGAAALLRDDIGRLAVGAKADIVLVDLKNPLMQPARDPLRCLLYTAADRAVRDVFVDGRHVVADGRVLTLDMADAADRLTQGQARMLAGVSGFDDARRSAEEIAPLSLPTA
jgi:cytosine/adenosine deaminase-related metal-dependent hydrolase